MLISNSTAVGLSKYPTIWQKYFRPNKTLNCGISGVRRFVESWGISVPPSVKYVEVHCDTNNLDHDEPKNIGNVAINKIGKIFQQKSSDFIIILTGLLP